MSEGERVIRVAARGDGVTASGRHVPLAAPGDHVLADGTIVPGPRHQVPPCRHFPVCGGCQLQHLDEEAEAEFARDRVVGALAAQGLPADVRPARLSPARSRRRTVLHADRGGAIGFAEAGSHRLVDLSECAILAPELFALLAPLRRLLPRLIARGRRAEVTMTIADQGVDLLLRGVEAEGLAAAEALRDFAEGHALARLAIDSGLGAETRWEPRAVTVTLGGVAVPLPHGAFLQATRAGEEALVAAAREAVGAPAATADLFAGLGTFALMLPGKVYAAEGARDAALSLRTAAGGRALFVEHRDLYRRPLMPAELDRFDAVMLDPPRAGAREQAIQLAASRVPVIAYVSCNPSSFARDAKILCDNGYAIDWVLPVGQFRWSTHVELAARLARQG